MRGVQQVLFRDPAATEGPENSNKKPLQYFGRML